MLNINIITREQYKFNVYNLVSIQTHIIVMLNIFNQHVLGDIVWH